MRSVEGNITEGVFHNRQGGKISAAHEMKSV